MRREAHHACTRGCFSNRLPAGCSTTHQAPRATKRNMYNTSRATISFPSATPCRSCAAPSGLHNQRCDVARLIHVHELQTGALVDWPPSRKDMANDMACKNPCVESQSQWTLWPWACFLPSLSKLDARKPLSRIANVTARCPAKVSTQSR
eukprot:15438691-Alexandrium_andersonii.AAC.1